MERSLRSAYQFHTPTLVASYPRGAPVVKQRSVLLLIVTLSEAKGKGLSRTK